MISNRYEIIRQIDEGGISKVYLANDQIEKRKVVIRILKKEAISNRIEDVIRFHNEALILSRLAHPNIANVYEVGEYESENYIAMEYILGESLYKIIKRSDRLSEEEVIDIIIQMCQALEYIHGNNIIHRDLKPGNIMITKSRDNRNQVKIIDFGLALVREYSALKKPTEIVGTFCYMSPEHFGILKRSVDERSDLYSLGIILYELLTGEPPFLGESISEIIHRQICLLILSKISILAKTGIF
jgi:serine/threonine-protein kinase